MEKRITKQQMKSILDYEAHKVTQEGTLSQNEIRDYLVIIASEMSTWTNLNYISYWQNESDSHIIK